MRQGKYYFVIIVLAVACSSLGLFYYWQESSSPALGKTEAAIASSPRFPAPENTDYQMQLYLDTSQRVLYGTTVLTTINTSGQPLQDLWLTVYPNCFRNRGDTPAPAAAYYAGFDPGGLEFEFFRVNGQEVQIKEKSAGLQVLVADPLEVGEDIRVEMKWQAKIPRLKYRYGTTDQVYMLGNFYPALNIFTAEGWHQSYNSRFGDPFCFPSADYLVSLNLPADFQVVSTGQVKGRLAGDDGRETWLMEAQQARDFCLLLTYGYQKLEESIEGTLVQCHFPGSQEALAREVLQQAGQMLHYYSCRFGSYPYPEFKVAFVPMQGFNGMEYSGLIFLREEFLQAGNDIEKQKFILAHEIAHQWWYGIVGSDQLGEPWLDEGLANWSAYHYLHDLEGQALPTPASVPTAIDLSKELGQMYSRQDYYLTAYTGGEAFWWGLEEKLGQTGVLKVLRSYLAGNRNDIATAQKLIEIIKKEAQQNMDEYLNKWFPSET